MLATDKIMKFFFARSILTKRLILFCTLSMFVTTVATAQTCVLNEDAQKYLARARVAEKTVKEIVDYKNAIDEYVQAFKYAPTCPDIAFDIALCYEQYGKVDAREWKKAVEYYKKYLELKPNAADKEQVKNKIYKLEYAIEKNDAIILSTTNKTE
jgi:tetratricopeptide (TPR) repeat protein